MISNNNATTEMSLVTESKLLHLGYKLSFMRYFLYILIPYFFSNLFTDLINETIPSTIIEYYMIVFIFILSILIFFQSIVNKIIWNYNKYTIIFITFIFTLISSIICIYYQIINFNYQLMALSIGYIISMLIGSYLQKLDKLQYQTIKLNYIKYKPTTNNNLFIAKTGIFRIHFINYIKIDLKTIPQESLYLLSTLLNEFQVTISENTSGVSLYYNKYLNGYIFQQNKLRKELIDDYLLLRESMQNLLGNSNLN